MNYTVLWSDEAYNSLVDLVSAVQMKDEVVSAVQEIHGRLAESPEKQGESRPNGRRIMFAAPLGVIFTTKFRLRQVLVSRAWGYLPPSP